MKKRIRFLLLIMFVVCISALIYLYAGAFYPAQEEALACIADPTPGVDIFVERKRLVFSPECAKAGLIFYPGGNVAVESYAPLMQALAQQGIFCVLVEMPAALAILDMDAAEAVCQDYPAIERWYLSGHSLGGYAAADYLGKAHAQYEGLILLASYTRTDLRDTDLKVLSIYGSEDGVMNRERYAQGVPLLPEGTQEIVIEGGNHSFFGAYGMQSGDGEPTITREKQIQLTAQAISALIGE